VSAEITVEAVVAWPILAHAGDLVLPMTHLTLVTGANGSGKSSLYRALRLLSDAALNGDAFPGSRIGIDVQGGRFEVQLQQHGLLRPLSGAELSDGTLRFLLWTAALLTPRPPELMVLNEPETSLHPDLIPALARLIIAVAGRSQIIVVSRVQPLIQTLEQSATCGQLHLEKSFGETVLSGATLSNSRKWEWPSR
jgi:predicted ATPase